MKCGVEYVKNIYPNVLVMIWKNAWIARLPAAFLYIGIARNVANITNDANVKIRNGR